MDHKLLAHKGPGGEEAGILKPNLNPAANFWAAALFGYRPNHFLSFSSLTSVGYLVAWGIVSSPAFLSPEIELAPAPLFGSSELGAPALLCPGLQGGQVVLFCS